MIKRAAYFADNEELEEQLMIPVKSEFKMNPNYNIAHGDDLPTLVKEEIESEVYPKKIRWGTKEKSDDAKAAFDKDEVWSLIKNKKTKPSILLLSGFYVWKKDRENEHPFFVRMLNNPIMCVAGFVVGDDDYTCMVVTDSNPLIHPMSEKMPLILNNDMMKEWLRLNGNPTHFLSEFKNPLLLTDFSVLRVSKKVNDPANNDAKLIQPIPK